MNVFYRYPQTPHLVWLGTTSARNDKILPPVEVERLLQGHVSVEEKLDGANLGISLGDNQKLQFQNRGHYLTRPFTEQFSRLNSWEAYHSDELLTFVKPGLIVFGEWLAACHSVHYRELPDWFITFDVYDRGVEKFWCVDRRDILAGHAGLTVVPRLFRGRADMATLTNLVTEGHSQVGATAPEGIIVRSDNRCLNERRAKIVRPGFIQDIGEHWRRRKIEWNRVISDDHS